MQYSNVLLLSKDNLLRNTLQTRISNLFSCNILEGAKWRVFEGIPHPRTTHKVDNSVEKIFYQSRGLL